jgi:hypothetical protein
VVRETTTALLKGMTLGIDKSQSNKNWEANKMANVTIETKGKKKTFAIEVEGQKITRTTTADYKFAIISFDNIRNKWFAGFSATIENAQKTAEKDASMSRFEKVEIIELIETKEVNEENIFACDHDKTGLPKGAIVACTNCGKTF